MPGELAGDLTADAPAGPGDDGDPPRPGRHGAAAGDRDGGRNAAKGLVTTRVRLANRYKVAGLPPREVGRAAAGRRLDDAAAGQHPLQVGGRERVAERGGVDVAQLGDRERRGGQREADVGVGQLGPQPVPARLGDRPVVERGGRQVPDRVPGGVRGQARLDVGGHQGQVGGGQDAAPGIALGVAPGLQLLEIRDVGELDLGGQVPAQGRAQSLIWSQRPAGQGPQSLERRRAPPPEQDVKTVAANLQDHGQGLMGEALPGPRQRGRQGSGPGHGHLAVVVWHVRMVLSHRVLDYEAKRF